MTLPTSKVDPRPRAWYKLGEYDAACHDIERAAAQSPYDVNIRYHLDRIREALAKSVQVASRELEHG
jgi:hypothetical protein